MFKRKNKFNNEKDRYKKSLAMISESNKATQMVSNQYFF